MSAVAPSKSGVYHVLSICCYVCVGIILKLSAAGCSGTCLKPTSIQVSQEECEILRESVPYVELYWCNPKHLYPNLNGYGDNGQRSLKL